MTIKPNIVDRIVGIFSPRRMAERVQARAYLASAEFQASYRGGVKTRTDTTWGRSTSYEFGSHADRVQLGNMRDRAKRVYHQSHIGRSILDTETDYVVGDGMTLQSRTGDEEFDKEAEERFSDWMDRADVRGMLGGTDWQRLSYRQSRQDGDGGIVLIDRGGESRIQIIPGDLIQTPDGQFGKANIVDGVEVNSVGRPVRFHLLIQNELGKRDFSTVSAENFKYLAWTTEPLTIRGETCYAQIFSLLDQIDGYTDAVVVAARMAAIFGLIFKEATAPKQFAALGTRLNGNGDQQKALTIDKNGMAKYIGPDDSIVQVQAQQPMAQTPDFIRAMLRLIGLPFGMPLEVIGKDASTTNLSALRGIRQEYARAVKPKQQRFVWAYLTPIYQWWVSREVNAGKFTTPAPAKFWTHEWMPARSQFTDAITEAQAIQLEIDMGINSPQRACAELGRDHEAILQENAAANKSRKKKELPEIRSTLTRDPMTQIPATARPAPDDKEPDDGEHEAQA